MKTSKTNLCYKITTKCTNYIVNITFGAICVISSTLLITFGIPIILFRAVLNRLAKHLRPDLGSMLNPLSSTMVSDLCYSDKPPRTNLVVPITLEGRFSAKDFEKLVFDKLVTAQETDGTLKYPQFSQFPVSWLGFMFWKTDPNFDIKNHVHSYGNHNNGETETTTAKDYDQLVETLLNARHPPKRSPWEFHLLHNFRDPKIHSGEMSVFVFKSHHSLADGFSILHCFTEALAGQSEFQLPKVRIPKRGLWERLAYILTIPFSGIIELVRVQKEMFVDSPWKIPDGEKAWHQLYAKSELIPIQQIKQIKNMFGVTFTSVILAAISKGINDNLRKKRLNGSIRVNDEVDKMVCLSVLPLPVKKGMERLTNNATGAIFNIPAGNFQNSLERLHACDRVLEKTKRSVVPPLLSWYIAWMGSYFRWLCRPIIRNRNISTGLTNFPCVGEDFFGRILGLRIIFNEFAAGGLEGVAGVGFMVASCRKDIRVAVTAEKGLLTRTEVDELVKCVEDEIHNLYSLSNSKK